MKKVPFFLCLLFLPFVSFGATFGTTLFEAVSGAVTSTDGGRLLYGVQYSNSQSDVFFVKLDSLNNVVWSTTIGDPVLNEAPVGVVPLSSGSGYLTLAQTSLSCYMFFIKLNLNGTLEYTSLLPEPNPNPDPSQSCYEPVGFMQCDTNLFTVRYFVDGPTANNYFDSFNVDSNSTLVTNPPYCYYESPVTTNNWLYPGAIEYPGGVIYDTNYQYSFYAIDAVPMDSGLLIAGMTNYFSQGVMQNLLVRTYNFDTLWTRVWGTGNSSLNGIKKRSNDRFYLTGTLDSLSVTASFISLVDTSANILWRHLLPPEIRLGGILILPNGNVFAYGDSISPGVTDADYWWIELDLLGGAIISSVPKIDLLLDINLFPNPSTEGFYIKSSTPLFIDNLRIINVLGQEIYDYTLDTTGSDSVFVSGLKPGTYFVLIPYENRLVKRKIFIH